MAAVFIWGEENGAQTASISGSNRGATRTFGVSNVNWKNIDDTTTAYSSSPITAGNNSYNKYQFGVFSGSFNQISNVVVNHTGGSFGAGFKLAFTGTSGYATPVTTTQTWADLTLTGLLSTGLPLLLGMSSPTTAHKTTLTTTGYTAFISSQLQTTISAAAGDLSSTIHLAVSYDES